MEKSITDQIVPTLKNLPVSVIKSYFKKSCSSDVIACKTRTGGFVKGVCHPNGNYEQLKKANLGWIRIDIPYPFDDNGDISKSYEDFRIKVSEYKKNGIKVMAVTPYPYTFIEHGLDPRLTENEEKICSVARFIVTDLRDSVGIFQITNEMGIPRFTIPLTMDEAARFIGIQAKAVFNLKGNSLVGYNCAGPQVDLHEKLKPFMNYMDYVGLDLYLGCFMNITCFMNLFDSVLRFVWEFTGKPVLMCEFGYMSGGAPKTAEERSEILARYGASSEKDAAAHIRSFVDNFPDTMKEYVRRCSPDESHQADYIFKSDFRNHFYCELPSTCLIPGYPHTPGGQADFYRDVFKRFAKLDFLIGAFIYCYSDSDRCYVCGQADCPTETRWGLVDCDGNEKPAYYAVRDALASIH